MLGVGRKVPRVSLRKANRREVNHYVKATKEDQPEYADT
ncbi:protein of unknown function [Cyanobium sp. NIES-981]|nr:protein of unknown function [Cyanobium sp. NIES-981]